jgi:L,D-transpeptidase YcbB
MSFSKAFVAWVFTVAVFATPSIAEEKAATVAAPVIAAAPVEHAPLEPVAAALADRLKTLPETATEPERKDGAALTAFYTARNSAPIWVTDGKLSPKAGLLVAELQNAGAYALDPRDFKLPAAITDAASAAAADVQLSVSALAYARYARGGRIADPAQLLSTQLDRRPQWIDPKVVLDGLAATDAPDAYLRDLQPKHVQFESLRQFYLAAIGKHSKGGKLSSEAKRLRANMEMWRWLPDDMGTQAGIGKGMYVLNNIPEYMQYVYKDGEIVRSEKIVVGQLDKQSALFSRPLKYVVLRPLWKVPESIKVNELWPGLLKGGKVMRKFGLEVENKDGEKVDWHKIKWATVDIKEYEFVQPPGSRSVLGHVKFSFPSQHTIYMHDTPDKYMFNSSQRTLSHGCLRVRNPMDLARMILSEDKGWDAEKVAELDSSGPLNNEIAIDKRIPIHLVYFTQWVTDRGDLKKFADIYGHEKRVIQALDGKWDEIDHGYDHLAPVEAKFNPNDIVASTSALSPDGTDNTTSTRSRHKADKSATLGDLFGDPLGLGW